MVGKINIIGLIGSNETEKGVELIDVIQQVKSQLEATSFEIIINSRGGFVNVGFQIFDYLKSIPVPKKTIASDICASIATVIFLAGDQRSINAGCQFMIHSPFMSPFDYMNASEMEMYMNELKSTEKMLINFYEKNTKLNSTELIPLLQNESFLTESQCFDFGFSTQKNESQKAIAYFIKPIINIKKEEMNDTLSPENKSWLETQFKTIANLLKPAKIVNLTLQDSNGVNVVFPDLADDAIPAVNDVATVDGQPAQGDYIMPQLEGAVVSFETGVVVEIATKDEESNEELATLQAKIDALESEKATLANQLQTVNTAFVNFKKDITSKFDFTNEKERNNNENQPQARRLLKD